MLDFLLRLINISRLKLSQSTLNNRDKLGLSTLVASTKKLWAMINTYIENHYNNDLIKG